MKKINANFLAVLIVFGVLAIAQAQTKTVTLVASNNVPSSYDCSTNQVITINSFIGESRNAGTAGILFDNGFKTSITCNEYGINYLNAPIVFASNAVFTGVTNITVSGYNGVVALTFTVTTPTVQSFISANTVVVPTDAIGTVQIVLESSSDLVNWNASLPGTYGNTYSNRFFRVRAIAQ